MKPNNTAVQLTNVTKQYGIHHEHPTLIKQFFKGNNETFFALNNISLHIQKGERIGIIGPNGAGKTTLLKIISGITTPTVGEVQTYGRIVSLISQDAGFNPDLTGEQNIYLNALLLGMRKHEIHSKISDIIEFADIGQFIDAPFYTYSEGMKFRLGFAIAAHANADIILMDESMNVIDRKFEKRAVRILKDLAHRKKTFIISTHNVHHIRQFCSRVLLLHKGKIVKEVPKSLLAQYV